MGQRQCLFVVIWRVCRPDDADAESNLATALNRGGVQRRLHVARAGASGVGVGLDGIATNSSPPTRAAEMALRMPDRNAAPTGTITASPAPWARPSFTALKLSQSRWSKEKARR